MEIITMNPLVRLLGIGPAEREFIVKDMECKYGGSHISVKGRLHPTLPRRTYDIDITAPSGKVQRFSLMIFEEIKKAMLVGNSLRSMVAGHRTFKYGEHVEDLVDTLDETMAWICGKPELPGDDTVVTPIGTFQYEETDANIRNWCTGIEIAKELATYIDLLGYFKASLDPYNFRVDGTRLAFDLMNAPVDIKEMSRILARYGIKGIVPLWNHNGSCINGYVFFHFGNEVRCHFDDQIFMRAEMPLGEIQSLHELVGMLNAIGDQ